jgi:uncharacterized protein (TIGR03000 family)
MIPDGRNHRLNAAAFNGRHQSRRIAMFRCGIWTVRIVLLAALVVGASTPAFADRGRVVRHGPVYHGGYYHGWAPHVYHHGYYHPYYGFVYLGVPYYVPYSYPYPVVVNTPTYVPYYTYSYNPTVYAPTIYVPNNTDVSTGGVIQAAATTSAPATIEVHVPANAQLWFEDTPTDQTGEWRRFTSPPLPPDQVFYYKLRARWNDSGQTVEQTRTIEVRAGKTTTVDFTRA